MAREIQDFDIGLYPSLPKYFNQHKCSLKAFEYMASGIPIVSSPAAIDLELISDRKDGLFADSKEEWAKQLHY